MRPLALLGLVLSLVLAAVAVFVTIDDVHAARSAQDRSLQAAASSEVALISSGQRQTMTALSLMLVNPSVREELSARSLSASARRNDLADTALALAAIRRVAPVPLSAACLDDGAGRQIMCASSPRTAAFPLPLGRRFATIVAGSMRGAASSAFVSPVTHARSVAFLAPFRVEGRVLGLVHLDVTVDETLRSSVLVNDTPGVRVQLATYQNGRLVFGSVSRLTRRMFGSPVTLSVGAFKIGSRPQYTPDTGHRAMVVTIPLLIAGGRQTLAAVATAIATNPTFLNAWSPGMLAILALACLTLMGSIVGLVVSYRRITRELSTDPLTGLYNRRALMEDLPRVCQRASDEAPAFLWFFDLNGFKHYNDSFGHLAGDALLARLGGRLRESIGHRGGVYRLGGDEFCVIISTPIGDPHALFQEARDALAEQGGAFTVTASAGAVEIPRETREPTQALRLADQHMYREKAATKGGAAELITSVLHAALAQRHPDLGEHSDDVAGDVERLARSIGLDDDAINLVVKAGDLHDIGKLGIPDEIIAKPGPLSEAEWDFMKKHTLIGEQIIAAAGPSLERVGPLVRASHERWDGTGYPDRLAGEDIPLGARIVAICDSFRAMLDERVYKPPMPLPDALAELRRCAGSQFDPQLVEVFCCLIESRTDPRRVGSTAG